MKARTARKVGCLEEKRRVREAAVVAGHGHQLGHAVAVVDSAEAARGGAGEHHILGLSVWVVGVG